MTIQDITEEKEKFARLIAKAGIIHWNLTHEQKFKYLSYDDTRLMLEEFVNNPMPMFISGLIEQSIIDKYKMTCLKLDDLRHKQFVSALYKEAQIYVS